MFVLTQTWNCSDGGLGAFTNCGQVACLGAVLLEASDADIHREVVEKTKALRVVIDVGPLLAVINCQSRAALERHKLGGKRCLEESAQAIL